MSNDANTPGESAKEDPLTRAGGGGGGGGGVGGAGGAGGRTMMSSPSRLER